MVVPVAVVVLEARQARRIADDKVVGTLYGTEKRAMRKRAEDRLVFCVRVRVRRRTPSVSVVLVVVVDDHRHHHHPCDALTLLPTPTLNWSSSRTPLPPTQFS